jgi:hypothetical protein
MLRALRRRWLVNIKIGRQDRRERERERVHDGEERDGK